MTPAGGCTWSPQHLLASAAIRVDLSVAWCAGNVWGVHACIPSCGQGCAILSRSVPLHPPPCQPLLIPAPLLTLGGPAVGACHHSGVCQGLEAGYGWKRGISLLLSPLPGRTGLPCQGVSHSCCLAGAGLHDAGRARLEQGRACAARLRSPALAHRPACLVSLLPQGSTSGGCPDCSQGILAAPRVCTCMAGLQGPCTARCPLVSMCPCIDRCEHQGGPGTGLQLAQAPDKLSALASLHVQGPEAA